LLEDVTLAWQFATEHVITFD